MPLTILNRPPNIFSILSLHQRQTRRQVLARIIIPPSALTPIANLHRPHHPRRRHPPSVSVRPTMVIAMVFPLLPHPPALTRNASLNLDHPKQAHTTAVAQIRPPPRSPLRLVANLLVVPLRTVFAEQAPSPPAIKATAAIAPST